MSIFIVVGKSSQIVVAVLQAIRSFTRENIVVVGDHETAPLRWSTLCSRNENIRFDGSNDDRLVSIVNTIVGNASDVRLIAADCEGTRIINRVRARLNAYVAPMPDLPTLQMFDDKWQFYEFCVRHGFRVPMTCHIGTKHDLDYDVMAARLGIPFVVKPVNQAGSLGVQIVSSQEDYKTKILNNDDYRFSPLIAQQFIDGADIDASLLSIDGRMSAVAIQQASRSSINFLPNEYLEQVSAEICKVSAYHGVMHIDARIERSSGKVFLIEVNPRFWASLTAAVWCGLNFVAESLYHTPGRRDVLKLIDGKAFTRHPVIRPRCWPHLAFDQGYRGRLVRASIFDPWSISHLASDLPSMCLRYAKRKASLRSGLSGQKQT